jgi:hypothetical protein
MDMTAEAWGSPAAVNLPGLSIRVDDMLAALERVAGPAAAARVTRSVDPVIAKIVAGWATDFETARAAALGFTPDADFDGIVRAHIRDMGVNAYTGFFAPGYSGSAMNGNGPGKL